VKNEDRGQTRGWGVVAIPTATSEEVEKMLKFGVDGFGSEGNSSEGSQLMSILTRSRDSHGSGPVEVHVAHLVRDPLQLVRVQILSVRQHVVRTGTHGPLTSSLGNQEEVESGNRQAKDKL